MREVRCHSHSVRGPTKRVDQSDMKECQGARTATRGDGDEGRPLRSLVRMVIACR